MSEPFLSICIPSFNRPELLRRLLESVDAAPEAVEIVICEDHAPRRSEARAAVEEFQANSHYAVTYHENDRNVGYDANLRALIRQASGEFVLFMGDDDLFVAGGLDRFISFLCRNTEVGYVLRSYCMKHPDGRVEPFRYFPESRKFDSGPDTVVALFRKSVSLAGFTFRRSCGMEFLTDRFDGTLLYQLYLMAEITLRHPAVYCDIVAVEAEQSFRLDEPNFGVAEAEKEWFEPGRVTARNSVNFMKGFFRITGYLDETYRFDMTPRVRRDISKYSYPVLSIQRKRGWREFLSYVRLLDREVHLNVTPYYYLYVVGLLVLGEAACDRLIVAIKSLLGRTPQL